MFYGVSAAAVGLVLVAVAVVVVVAAWEAVWVPSWATLPTGQSQSVVPGPNHDRLWG